MRDSGSPRADAEADFLRVRRQQMLSNLSQKVRGQGADSGRSLSFTEVVDALGRVSEQPLGLKEIPVDHIVGSVDKVRDFDQKFRPTSGRARERWERLALAVRTGQTFPPIDVYQIGEMYFVRDGHHRVSVCRALDVPVIDADVTRVVTLAEPTDVKRRADLTPKELRRAMLQRVPLRKSRRTNILLSDPDSYPFLAEMIEAWAARKMFADGKAMTRGEASVAWYEEEFLPVVEMIDRNNLRLKDETDADAYMRIAGDRYRAMLDHVWNDDVFQVLRDKQVRKGRSDLLSGNLVDMLNMDLKDIVLRNMDSALVDDPLDAAHLTHVGEAPAETDDAQRKPEGSGP